MIQSLPALLADAAGLILAFTLLPALATRFQQMGFANSILLGLVFILFCLAVYGLRKLEDESAPPAWLSRLLASRLLVVFGVLGAIYVSFTILYVSGFLDSIPALNRTLLDEPSSTIYLLLTPATWFGLTLVYALLLSSPTERSRQAEGRAALVTFLGLSGVNLMLVAGAAVWQALWLRFPPAAPALVFLLLLLLHFLVYLPPRLLYLSRRWPAARWSLLTFFPLLIFVSWLAVSPAR